MTEAVWNYGALDLRLRGFQGLGFFPLASQGIDRLWSLSLKVHSKLRLHVGSIRDLNRLGFA